MKPAFALPFLGSLGSFLNPTHSPTQQKLIACMQADHCFRRVPTTEEYLFTTPCISSRTLLYRRRSLLRCGHFEPADYRLQPIALFRSRSQRSPAFRIKSTPF
ncbi:hypothetical protein EJ08DRAFT_644357, partial [Tothia fuscella]